VNLYVNQILGTRAPGLGVQFVDCRPFRSHRDKLQMDYIFFMPPPRFFYKPRAQFDVTLDDCWYWRMVLPFLIRVRTGTEDAKSRSVLKNCYCAMIDCLYEYAPRRRKTQFSLHSMYITCKPKLNF